MLEFLQLEIGWNDVKPIKICFADDLRKRPFTIVVANRAIQGLIVLDVKFRLDPEQSLTWRLVDQDRRRERGIRAGQEIVQDAPTSWFYQSRL